MKKGALLFKLTLSHSHLFHSSMSYSLLHFPSKSPLPLSFHKSLSFPQKPIFFSKTPLKPLKQFLTISTCSSSNSFSSSEEYVLQSIEFDENNPTTSLPAARTYENDLGRLSLVGTVAFEQALTAAAADGGEAADEHINADMSSMVVETVFPGPSDEKSTVSTRLFLPSRNVKEKARKVRSSLPADMLSSTTSRNILAMTFRQVVLQHIWSFELQLFDSGAKINIEDLENRREVSATFTLSSSDERVLSVLAEAVSMYALESTEMEFREGSLVTASKSFFGWFQKPRKIASKDFLVVIYELAQDELVQNAESLFKDFNKTEISIPREMKSKYSRWMSSTYKNLEKIGGPEFIVWSSEYVPAYKLEIDANILKNVKFEGWKNSAENRWEVLLTHSQMVELADILDMYYGDIYTLPDKQLSCGVVTNFAKLSKNKNSTSLWKKLVIALVGGLFVVTLSTLAHVYRSRLYGAGKSPGETFTVPLSEAECYLHHNLDEFELQNLCTTIIEKIKVGVGWPGDIKTETDLGVWTGELPNCLKRLTDENEDVLLNKGDVDTISTGQPSHVDMSNTLASPSDQVRTDMTSVQDVASYQVVLSKDGNVVGFQPTSRVAVNHWASNPLAKELYKGRKLTPGLIEPSLKISRPDKIVLIELLISVNPDSWFALARPIRETN